MWLEVYLTTVRLYYDIVYLYLKKEGCLFKIKLDFKKKYSLLLKRGPHKSACGCRVATFLTHCLLSLIPVVLCLYHNILYFVFLISLLFHWHLDCFSFIYIFILLHSCQCCILVLSIFNFPIFFFFPKTNLNGLYFSFEAEFLLML